MTDERVRADQERRRSNAGGKHPLKKDRGSRQQRREQAIREDTR